MIGELERLLPERDASLYISMSLAWLRRARWSKTGPRYVKIGGARGRAIRYRRQDLDAYMAANTVETFDSRPEDAGGPHRDRQSR